MIESRASGYESGQRGAWLSILTYAGLTAVKLGVAWWGGSRALLADGVNNLTDVISSVALLFGLRIATRPADEDHSYGHQKAETVATIIVACVMGLVGLDVAVDAAMAAISPDLAPPHPAAGWVGLGSAAVMGLVALYNRRLARRTGIRALAAAAADNRSDALSSLGTVAGILGAQVGWPWLDPLAGLVIAVVILRTAWKIGLEAAHALTDGFDAEALSQIRGRVERVDGVVDVLELRARHLGNDVAVEVTIGVRPTLSLVEAHKVSDRVEDALQGFMCIDHVHVHMEPVSRRLGRRVHHG